MPPIRYPNFQAVPRSLEEKREIKLNNDFTTSYTPVEPYDFMDKTTPLIPKKTHFVRRFWETRRDYLFMLVFSNLSLYDALACAELTIRLGGYVVFVYIILTISVTLVISYLVIVISVYTKKSMLNFGAMIPLFTGFGYLLLGFCLVRAVLKMRLFMYFSLFTYRSVTATYSSCPTNLDYRKAESHMLNAVCVNIRNDTEVRAMHNNSECTIIQRSLMLNCGNVSNPYVLSTHILPSTYFYDIQSKYLSLVLALVAYGFVVFLVMKEMPAFVKGAEAATVLFFVLNVIIICSSFFVKGYEKGLDHLFKVKKWPDLTGFYRTIAVALPKLSELFLTTCAATGRLPLCTTPAIDCLILAIAQVVLAVTVCTSNVMMISVLSSAVNISFSDLGPEFVPFISAPFFMAWMPIHEQFWTTIYFFVHSLFCFYGVLTLFEAIYVNVVWYHGMNKFIITMLQIIAFFLVLYFYLLPDEDDINGWYLQNTAMNLPLLFIFCAAILIYGIFKIEEDISFMTSSPPAELMGRLIRVLPVLCVVLLIWGTFHIIDTFDTVVMYTIILTVAGEVILRLMLTDDHKSHIRSTSSYGPPNSTLRAERKEYVLEKKRSSSSSTYTVNRAIYLFNKTRAQDEANAMT